ncbi:hypothetical protein JR311_19935 (plasmid) [Bacillus velezensis]|uniref:hypothetical protein n=1 Tax=Bacillus velezensis TaxID=492670 RepID=UPI00195D1CFD|nr:hypothetical protein [Bacillus velezensis]QRV11476.1 hypothetical protein JR311_19935 [Bacillus velezensis]
MQKLPQYKMDVLNKVLESEKLTKLIGYDSPDALFKTPLESPQDLLYDRIFPFRFVPETVERQATYLTLGVNGFRRLQEGYKIYDDYQTGEIYFYLFTHHDLMKTDSGVRQDLILGELDNLFEGYRGMGMGELKLRYVNELWIHNNRFGGYSIAFTITDFK